eukprot:gene27769-36596_t
MSNIIEQQRLSEDIVQRATSALFKYVQKKSGEQVKLFDDGGEKIQIQLKVGKSHEQGSKIKPTRIPIPHSLFVPTDDDSICVFCRSEDKEVLSTITGKIRSGIRVISVDDLRKKYRQFEDRKKLRKLFSHFLVDERVMQQVINLLGKDFSARSNIPVSLRLPNKLVDNVDEVKKAIFICVDATYMHFPVLKKAAEYSKGSNGSVTKSTNITITFGSTAMDCSKVVENIIGGVPVAVGKLRNSWRDVLTLYLKTPFSAALPFYSSVPGDAALQALQPKTAPKSVENDKSGTESAAKVSAKSPLAGGKKAEKKAAKKESTSASEVKEVKEIPKKEESKDADSSSTKKKAVVSDGEKPSSNNPKKRKSSDSAPVIAMEESSAAPETLSEKEGPQDTEKEAKAVSKRSKGAAKQVKEDVPAPILDLAQAEAALKALESELTTKKKTSTGNKKEDKKKKQTTSAAPVSEPPPPTVPTVVATVTEVADVSVAASGRVTRSRSRSNSMASDSGDESGKVVKVAAKPAKTTAMPPIAEEVESPLQQEVTDRKRKTPAKKAIEPAVASEGTPAAAKRRRGEAEELTVDKVVEKPKVESKQPQTKTKTDKKVKAVEVGEPAAATRKRSKSSGAKGE